MGCCSSVPKPAQADEIPKQFEIDPEESEHGGFVNTAAIAKLSQQQQEQQQANAHPQTNTHTQATAVSGGAGAHQSNKFVDEHARVMSREGSQQSRTSDSLSKRNGSREEANQESSTILGRMSIHKKHDFFHAGFKGDPVHILVFLNDIDLARLSQTGRMMHGLVEGFISIRFAKQEARADWSVTDWMKLGLGSRGGGQQWNKLRRRLVKEENVNVREELVDELTPAIFREKYEAKCLPCLVRGCAQDWKAFTSTTVWTLDSLASRFPNTLFRFNDLHGEEILLKDYMAYARSTDDDSPLGLYDSQVGAEANDPRSVLLSEYRVPSFLGEDLFDLCADEPSRPPFRWLLLGVARSGTEMHIDPLDTSAWVTVLSGRKKWCMFPPNTDDKALGGVHVLARTDDMLTPVVDSVIGAPSTPESKKVHAPTACEWFMNYYGTPGVKGTEGAVTLTQGPGDTVYIPGGWKHIVLNLEETVAITHNYAPKENITKIKQTVKNTEPEFYAKWEARLKERGLA